MGHVLKIERLETEKNKNGAEAQKLIDEKDNQINNYKTEFDKIDKMRKEIKKSYPEIFSF